jgi:Rrf2 family protein
MIRLTKKSEYGLLALHHIAMRSGALVSAKEIADSLNISYELTAKVLNQLARAGFLHSHQGVQGGYILARRAQEITLQDVISTIEGGVTSRLVECSTIAEPEPGQTSGCGCSVYSHCTIKQPMAVIQERINHLFRSMTIADLSSAQLSAQSALVHLS